MSAYDTRKAAVDGGNDTRTRVLQLDWLPRDCPRWARSQSNASNRRKRPRSFPPDMCEDSPLLTLILQAFVLSHPKPDLILRDQKMVVLIIRGIIDNVGYT